MTSQVQQVARTYVTRRSLWLFGAFALFSFGPGATLLVAGGRVDKVPPMLAAVGLAFPAAITSFVLATQAKWQFCDSRARLIPEFTTPHIAVLAAIALFAFGVYPAVLTLAGGWNSIGVPACAIVVAAGSIWTIHSGQWLAGGVAFGTYLSLMSNAGLNFWINPDNARRLLPLHGALLVGGWAALAAWLARLPRIREEDDDYFIPVQAYQCSSSRMERTQAARTFARAMLRSRWTQLPSDWWHDRLARIRATTAKSRQRLLRYGFTPSSAWMHAAPVALMFFAMLYFMTRTGLMSGQGTTRSILPSLNMMIIMPTMMAGGMLMMRRGRMAQELLLPLSRRDYVDGLLAAAAWSSLVTWLSMHAALLALLAALSPEMLTPALVAGLTALSLAMQLCAFGITALISPNVSGGKRMALMMGVVFIVVIPLMLGIEMIGHPGVTREEAVAQAFAEETRQHATLPADVREQIAKDQRQIARTKRHAEENWEQSQPWHAAWLWSTIAVTATIGLVATHRGRRRWQNYELA